MGLIIKCHQCKAVCTHDFFQITRRTKGQNRVIRILCYDCFTEVDR